MPAKSTAPRVPSLRHHKATDQGYVVIDGRYLYLGRFGDSKTVRAYHRTITEWIGNGYQLQRDPNEITVTELVAAFWKHAQTYYVKMDGSPTGETEAIKVALRPLTQLYGTSRAAEFGPRALKAVRQHMIDKGWSRTGINNQVGRIKRCFRWGVEHEMVAASVLHGLQAVPGLRRGRTEARETKPVTPVLEAHVTALLPFVSRQVGAMIGLQLLTAARPGEIVMLRPIDFDTSGSVWLAKLDEHKTAYRGRERILYFGPKAQQIVKEFFVDTPLDGYLFRPIDAEEERLAVRRAARKTPLSCGNTPGSNKAENPQWQAGERYTTHSYRRAIERACHKAKIPVWSPNRLRHNAGTVVRREFGLESAQLILGHARCDTTQVYAETNHRKALEVAEKMG